jgi:hypothetical protein
MPVRILSGMTQKFLDLRIYDFLLISPSESNQILRNTNEFLGRKTIPASSLPYPTLGGTAVIRRNLDTSDKIWDGENRFRNFLW